MKFHPVQKDYDTEKEIHNTGSFIKCGLLVCSIILISGMAVAYGQNQLIETSANTSSMYTKIHNKKLPIYCVDQKEPKIALSFDAAWGESRILISSNNA